MFNLVVIVHSPPGSAWKNQTQGRTTQTEPTEIPSSRDTGVP